MPWTGIKRIAAFRRDIYLGVVVCLAVEIEDGATVHVIMGDPEWLDLMETLNKELPTALDKEKGFLDLAAGRQDVVLIYDQAEQEVPVRAQ